MHSKATMPFSSWHWERNGICWTLSKGQVWHLALLCSYFQGPLPSLHSSPLEHTLNLSGSKGSTDGSKTQHTNHKEEVHSSAQQFVCLSRSIQVDPLSEASAWSKLAFETIGRKPLWRGWCGGNVFVFISKWETTGGKEVWQPCCLFRSFGVFKSQTHLNHICCFQNDSRILSAQKPLCCLEAVNLKKWKCYTDKRKATDLAETESSPRCYGLWGTQNQVFACEWL